jgi:hypothetical protein
MNFIGEISENQIDKALSQYIYTAFTNLYQPHITTSDGNCLWHMVSIALCGNEILTVLLRKLTVLAIIVLKKQITNVLSSEFEHFNSDVDGNTVVTNSKLKTFIRRKLKDTLLRAKNNKKWGNQYHLLVLSSLLNKNIFIYSGFKLRNGKLQLDKNVSEAELINAFNDRQPIGHNIKYEPIENEFFKGLSINNLYGFYHDNHYVALVPRVRNHIIFLPKNNIF